MNRFGLRNRRWDRLGSPRSLDRLRLAVVLGLAPLGLRSLRRLTGSSERPLPFPPGVGGAPSDAREITVSTT
jgi:hypothetical protein